MKNETSESFKANDAASYDSVADDFERLTQQVTLPVAAKMLELARLDGGSRVLDVGCGTGVLTRLAAKRASNGAHFLGVDLSDGLLAKARALSLAEGLDRHLEFRKSDAEALELADASVDAVLSVYALRHFPNPRQALREMLRVVRPGGRAVVAVGSAPPFGSLAFIAAAGRVVLERVQLALGRGPLHATAFLDGLLDDYLGHARREEDAEWTQGSDRFSGSVSSMMREVGFTRVQTEWVGETFYLDSAAAFWTLQATLSTRARKRIAVASGQQVARLKQAFDDICKHHLARGGKLIYRSGALIAIGERPPA